MVDASRLDLYVSTESGVCIRKLASASARFPMSCGDTASEVDGHGDAGDACDPDPDRWMATVSSDSDPAPDRRRPNTVCGDSPGLVTKNGGVDCEGGERSSAANRNDV